MDAETLYGPECVKGKQKIKESKGEIERLKRETWDEVSQIRVEADAEENRRRQIEEQRREERYNIIRNETIQSSTKNEAAQIKWDDLLELDECEELFAKIQEQKGECLEILETKNKLILEFLDEIKEKDAFYWQALHKEKESIVKMIELMQSQYEQMRGKYEKELQDIEDSFLAERSDLLRANKQVIDDLFKRHRELEEKFTRERQEEEEKNTDDLENKRDEEANSLHKTKVLVETNLQTLETYMEEMKAVYQLNQEKLFYNVRILEEREMENTTTFTELTRRKRNLKNSYILLSDKVAKNEERFMKQNVQLTDKFKKMSKAFNELRKKFRHFEKADTQKFSEIWEMNESEVKDLAGKVLKCDKVIYEQQLGLHWEPPEDNVINIEIGSLSEGISKEKDESVSKQLPSQSQSQAQVPISRIKQVFALLVQECSFLIEDKVKDSCIGLSENEQFTLKIDSIRKTIRIETMEDVQVLVNMFYERAGNNQDELFESGQEEDLPDPDELTLDPSEVIDLLMSFQDYKTEQENGVSLSKVEPSAFTVPSFGGESDRERRQKVLMEEKRHWTKLGGVLQDRHLRVWKALEKGLTDYYELLQERQNLVEETGVLHQQNEELKSLLQQYLQAGVNQELQVPPTQMLKIGDEEQEEG